ncbi:GntR family transcriptional regulator [Salinicola sp. DM10]|uniref:GntR family transcriptional regulator n=1 Tax=Salinicola sp. DM10 TaxID=2815721 RepID=UPI001A8C30A2|nr:GntR family transcriptional regulator [Salinicola sp. DM10]MCE3028670.1 GntR family transcriptional regulator [Salinicola sp. DM10]
MRTSSLQTDERLPLYQRLRDDMLSRIASGEWAPGIAIPTEAELTKQYGVAVGTLRKAVDTLVQDGLMERSQGRGTFIRRPNFQGSLFRFFRQVDALGERQVPTSRILSRTRTQASESVALALELPPGSEVIKLERLRQIGGSNVSREEIWLPAARFAGLMSVDPEAFENLLYPFYESQCGQLVASARETLTVETADAPTAKALEIAQGAPVVNIERLALGYDGTPLEFRRTLGNAETFRYQVDIT